METSKITAKTSGKFTKNGIIIPRGNLSAFETETLDEIFILFGLSINEQKISIALSNLPKTYATVSILTKIPKTTVKRTLISMKTRGIVYEIQDDYLHNFTVRGKKNIKETLWKSDLPKTLRRICQIYRAYQIHQI